MGDSISISLHCSEQFRYCQTVLGSVWNEFTSFIFFSVRDRVASNIFAIESSTPITFRSTLVEKFIEQIGHRLLQWPFIISVFHWSMWTSTSDMIIGRRCQITSMRMSIIVPRFELMLNINRGDLSEEIQGEETIIDERRQFVHDIAPTKNQLLWS